MTRLWFSGFEDNYQAENRLLLNLYSEEKPEYLHHQSFLHSLTKAALEMLREPVDSTV